LLKFRFHLSTLILVSIGGGCIISGIAVGGREYARFNSLQRSAEIQLDRIAKAARMYCDLNHNESLPPTLDELSESHCLVAPMMYYTNTKFPECNVGFCTIGGVDTSDEIWLFENVPQDQKGIDRYVLIGDKKNEYLRAFLISESEFQGRLAAILSKGNCRIYENDRTQSKYSSAGTVVYNDHVKLEERITEERKFGLNKLSVYVLSEACGLIIAGCGVLFFIGSVRSRRQSAALSSGPN